MRGRSVAVCGQQCERLAVERGDGAEVAVVECRQASCRPLIGEYDHRCVGESQLQVAVLGAQLAGGLEPSRVERLDRVGDGEVVEQRKLGVDAEPAEDEVVGFGGGEGGDDQLPGPGLQRGDDRPVVGVVGVSGTVEGTGVDDQCAYRPSSRRTISSALRATASPLPRPTPADRSRRGPAACVVRATASRMISACERPDSDAIRRSAAASRSSR
jgi:hypothetical protein